MRTSTLGWLLVISAGLAGCGGGATPRRRDSAPPATAAPAPPTALVAATACLTRDRARHDDRVRVEADPRDARQMRIVVEGQDGLTFRLPDVPALSDEGKIVLDHATATPCAQPAVQDLTWWLEGGTLHVQPTFVISDLCDERIADPCLHLTLPAGEGLSAG